MKRLLILFGLVFISSACASSFAQTNIKSEFVKLKTGDGITLHGALWTPASGKARLNKTAEKAMELMLPLAAKAEAKSEQALVVSETEISQYVGTYTNKPVSVEIVVKQGSLVLKREEGEFPIKKIGDHRFSIIKPNESEAEEFVLVRGADSKAVYLHVWRHALKKVG